jgi:hypothetical protein
VLARRGELGRAESLAREAVHTAEETDFLTMKADARMALAEVLAFSRVAREEAEAVVHEALELYRLKGNRAGAAWAEAMLGQRGSVGAFARLDGGDELV